MSPIPGNPLKSKSFKKPRLPGIPGKGVYTRNVGWICLLVEVASGTGVYLWRLDSATGWYHWFIYWSLAQELELELEEGAGVLDTFY
jgi:hypothetical protein